MRVIEHTRVISHLNKVWLISIFVNNRNNYKLILIGGLQLLIPVLVLPPFGTEGGGGGSISEYDR